MVGGVLDTTKNNGNIESQTINAPGLSLKQSYTYDQLNRLRSAEEIRSGSQQWKQTFVYDRFGNRTFDSAPANTTPNVLGPNPTIDPATNRFQTGQSYGYDSAGNLNADPTTAANAIAYDAENKQIAYTKNSTIQYSYDGEGRRVKKFDVSANKTTVFVYNLAGQLIAEYQSDPVTPPQGGGGTSYLTTDHLGSTRVVTTAGPSPTVKARYDYLPFGEQIGSTIGNRGGVAGYVPNDDTRQKFTQYERDSESGFDFAQARYCSTAQGRFNGVDPVFTVHLAQPQSWNRYAYCANNPLSYRDPTGTVWLTNGGDNPTYLWVDDEEFKRDRSAWAGWSVVPNGTIIFLGWVGPGYERFSKFVGGNVTLDADFEMTPLYDEDEFDTPIVIKAEPPDNTWPSTLVIEWALGYGPTHRYFGPDAYMTEGMMTSPDVALHRQNFIQQGGGKYGPVGSRFGFFAEDGPVTARASWTRQVVGSFTITITQQPGGDALFVLRNTTSLPSLLYHVPGIEPVERSTMLPLSNKTQEFWWIERGLIQR
jgi:RHS repeat-associated protein